MPLVGFSRPVSADQRLPLSIWIDPGCPWAWQTARWVMELRDRGLVSLNWRLFSLEVNTAGPDVPFTEAAGRYGESLKALALARLEGGGAGFETYYAELGVILHDERAQISQETARRAAELANMGDLVDRAVADPRLGDEIIEEYRRARELDVFGVPTLRLGESPVFYGPIMARAPTGAEAVTWWHHVSWLLGRNDIYEMKRWPRSGRPGEVQTSP